MMSVRLATVADASDVSRLLRDFNTEFHDVVPERVELAERMAKLIAGGETTVLLVGDAPDRSDGSDRPDRSHEPDRSHGPDGIAVLRFRQAIWAAGLECYLAELYIAPHRRGHGLGRALMEFAIEHAREQGAAWIDLGTSEDDIAARSLYESLGFSNREGGSGPLQYFYELEL